MKKITVSAPGKLMLLGEHAVVYNRPCLVTAVNQRLRATVSKTSDGSLSLEAPDVKVVGYKRKLSELGKGDIPKGAKFIEFAVRNFIKRFPISEGLHVETFSQFSSEFGFGSSSASTVCVIKALSELFGKKLSQKEIFDLSYQTLLDVSGKGSGFDIAAAVYGGILYYVTGGKVITPLKVDEFNLIVGYSGIKVDTVTVVNDVLAKSKKYPEVIENVYNQITILVEKAKSSLLQKNWSQFGELMNLNQGFLEVLDVSSPRLSAMIYAARTAGAYGAKLSGAGRGDCMIAVCSPEKVAEVREAINSVNGQVIDVKTNVPGVMVE